MNFYEPDEFVHDSDIQFGIADPSHDSAIRQLLRDCPISGEITLSLQREPSYFAGATDGLEHQTIIATQRGQIVAVGSVSVRQRFINRRPMRVGYLGTLRLNQSFAGRFDILRRGYRFLYALHDKLDVPFYITSIAADNHRAIRLLERGLPGMPLYEFAGELSTVILRTRPRRAKAPVQPLDYDRVNSVLGPLNATMQSFQFAPSWAGEELDSILRTQIPHGNFLVAAESNGPIACAAIWDQRGTKQAVVTRYSRRLALARPIWNAIAPSFDGFPLPPVGKIISQAFVSHLACPDARPDVFLALIEALSARAYDAGIEMLSIGLDARDKRLELLRRAYATRVYATRLYTVRWPEDRLPEPLDGRLIYPEVALL